MTASVLSAGRASRLYRAVRDRKLAGSVGAYHYSPQQVGVFVISAETEPEKAIPAARAMWQQLQLVRDSAISADEIERSKRLFASRWARRLETTEGQASYLAEWEAMGGWQKGGEYYDAFMQIGPSDVMQVTQRYLVGDHAGAVIYRPDRSTTIATDAATLRRAIETGTEEPLESSQLATPASVLTTTPATFVREETGVRIYRTPNGTPVLIRVNSGAAITYAGVYAAGGATQELPDRAGITTLVARSAPKGTATHTALQVAEASELLGGSISSSVGSESFGWSISVPCDNIAPALSLLADVVQHATLTPETVETERTALLSDIAQLRDDMYRYPMRLMQSSAFDGHPYGTPTMGTEASLMAISDDNIRAWYHRTVLRAPYVIAVVGDVNPDVIADLIAGQFAELYPAESSSIAAPVWPANVIQRAESREKAQTALTLAFPAPSRTDDDRFAAHLLATIASGLGGRFFDELRDRQSLAYTVHAFALEYRFAGAFVSYIATSPEQEQTARDGLLREFAKLRDQLVTQEELTRAKRYTLGMHDIRQERGGAVLGDMVDAWLFGTGLHELRDFTARVEAVSADDILRLARRYFDPDRRVEGIVRGAGKPT
jgi:zinc protease